MVAVFINAIKAFISNQKTKKQKTPKSEKKETPIVVHESDDGCVSDTGGAKSDLEKQPPRPLDFAQQEKDATRALKLLLGVSGSEYQNFHNESRTEAPPIARKPSVPIEQPLFKSNLSPISTGFSKVNLLLVEIWSS